MILTPDRYIHGTLADIQETLADRDAKIEALMQETAACQAALLWAADLFEAWMRDCASEPRGNWERQTWCLLGDALREPIVHTLVGERTALLLARVQADDDGEAA